MYPYIVCNCGAAIGDIYDAFKALRMREYQRHFARTGKYIKPEEIAISESARIDLRDVFEMLHVRLPCCKARLLSTVEYRQVY